MSPRELLEYNDTGSAWPPDRGTEFTDLRQAYEAALAVRALRIARGEAPRGYKIGFTNRTIWQRYNVFAPIWGSMWDTTVSNCSGAGSLSLAYLCQPRIEPEAVFGFKATPRVGAGLDDLFESLAWLAPGFEIVQSHRPDWKFIAPQCVADGGLHGRLLVGQHVPIVELAGDAGQLDRLLASARVGLHKSDGRVEEGSGANVLDSPLRALLHFLIELRSCPGAPDVVAGDIVTTGTWTDAWPVAPGEQWSARFDSVLPALQVRFTA